MGGGRRPGSEQSAAHAQPACLKRSAPGGPPLLPAQPDLRRPLPPLSGTPALLQEIHSADINAIAGAFFASSLRLKPRKPVVVTVSAVW